MNSVQKVFALIAEKLPSGMTKYISAKKLRDVLNPIAGSLLQQKLQCDPTITTEHIGLTLMQDTDGVIRIYEETPPSIGINPSWTVVFTGGVPNPEGQRAAISVRLVAVPALGSTLKVSASETHTYTFIANGEAPVGYQIALGETIDDTAENIKTRIGGDFAYIGVVIEDNYPDYMKITFSDANTGEGTQEAPNGVWHIQFNDGEALQDGNTGQQYFTGGFTAATRNFRLGMSGESEITIPANIFIEYEDAEGGVADAAMAAGGLYTYLSTNYSDKVTVEPTGETGLSITTVNPAGLSGAHYITSTGLPIEIVEVVEGVPEVPSRADKLFIGFLDGLEVEGGNTFAIIGTSCIRDGILIAGESNDVANMAMNPDMCAICAANGGKVRKMNTGDAAVFDMLGVIGHCITNVTGDEFDKPVKIKCDTQHLFFLNLS